MTKIILAAAAALVSLSTVAQADELPTAAYLPVAKAVEAANAAVESCKAKGFAVTSAIVARGGETSVLIHGDGAGPHTNGSATGKAFTSASMGRPSGALAGAIANNPPLAGLRDMDPRLVILAGGLPIRINGQLVGGIGVGGAPSGDIDAECAIEGLKAIGAEVAE